MYKFKVCPVQGRQLLDVREEDIFEDFRICDTYRGGGGYDQFPTIIRKRGLISSSNIGKQFVVQLYGCHLRCPYCYVTKDGIFGEHTEYTAVDLIKSFLRARDAHGVGVFHLMGGAPGLYMKHWLSIIERLPDDIIFTSDILLTEDIYEKYILDMICSKNAIYAVNIKGLSDKNYKDNTGYDIDWAMFWINMERLVNSGINFYLTFTNPALSLMDEFIYKLKKLFGERIVDDSFIINLKQYNAVKGKSAWS
jgi:pyruvate-formate lyase-activating enzyme